jgi:hypothetical protein
MNFADIQQAWQSPHNRPSAAELEKQKMHFITDLRRRHRSSFMLLVLTFIPMAFLTFKLVMHIVSPNPELDPVDLSREWGVVIFFALPWAGWLLLVRLHRRHRTQFANYEQSINASVAALLDENRTERIRTKVVGGLLLASVVILPVIVFQLRSVGKSGDEILIPAFVIYPVYVASMVGWLAYRYRRTLLPRMRELEGLLHSYAGDGK